MTKLPKKNRLNKYLELTGVVFQMGITIYLGAYIGKKLDTHFQNNHRLYTIISVLAALLISLYSVIVQLKKINEKDE